MKKTFNSPKHKFAFQTLQLKRALKRISVRPDERMRRKNPHELTFEEFKAVYVLDALILTKFNRSVHWEKFLFGVYRQHLIEAISTNQVIPINVLEHARAILPQKFLQLYMRRNGFRKGLLGSIVKVQIAIS